MEIEDVVARTRIQFINSKECNQLIRESFSRYLELLNFRILDLNDFFKLENGSCHFEIKSKTNEHLSLSFEFWNNQVNIYLGERQIQYADDANVRNLKEQNRFENELNTIFYNSVIEKISSERYEIIFNDKDSVTIANSISNHTKVSDDKSFERKYKAWLP